MLGERDTEATKVRLVMDNLNTHKIVSPYDTFDAAEIRRLAEMPEIYHKSEYGSWLNMVEIEFSSLKDQRLRRRNPKMVIMQAEAAAWK